MKIQDCLITVGIPTFNRADLLSRAIASIQTQIHTNLEIIISDNCSFDDTENVCRLAASQDSRIRYYRQQRPISSADNFNFVLMLATGEYFMWLGDDDWVDPEYIALCLAALQEDPEIILVSGTPQYYKGKEFLWEGTVFDVNFPSAYRRLTSFFLKVMDNGSFYGLFRTRVIRDLRLTQTFAADWVLIADTLLSGGSRMLRNTAIHRELGVSANYGKLCEALGMPRLSRWFPSIFVARVVNLHFRQSAQFTNLPFSCLLLWQLTLIVLLRPLTNIPFRVIRRLRMARQYFRFC